MDDKDAVASPPVTSPAKFRPPANSCDCHAHVYGPYAKFPTAGTRAFIPTETPFEAYMRMHEMLGIDRGVLTQPSHYGVDNACLLDAITRSKGTVKGIIVLEIESFTEREVERLSGLGVVGVRINDRPVGPTIDDIEKVAERLKGSNWHLEIVPPKIERVVALRSRLEKLPIPVIFDGLGHPDVTRGVDDPSFKELLSIVKDGLAWVKLSHPYQMAKHPYAEVLPFAQALAAANPNRCVFGLDWPHPGHQPKPPMPDDGFLLDLFPQWIPDPALQKKILVDNAAELYRF